MIPKIIHTLKASAMKIERRYSMEALAEILHDEEIRNGRDEVPQLRRIYMDITAHELVVVFDDDKGDE